MAALEQQATEKAEQKGKEPSKPEGQRAVQLHGSRQSDHEVGGPRLHPGVQRPGSGRRAAPDRRGGRRSPSKPTTKGGWCRWCTRWLTDWELVPEQVSADAGYWVERDVERLEWYDIEALVAPKKLRHSDWRKPPTAEGPPPEGLTTKQRMEHVLNTEEGRRKMMRRWVTVEPVFGQIKRAMGFREVLHAGDREGSGRVEARVYGPQSAEVVPQRSEHGAAALRGTTPQRRSRLKVPSRQLGYAVVGRQSLRHLRLRQLAASTHLASIRYPDGLLGNRRCCTGCRGPL